MSNLTIKPHPDIRSVVYYYGMSESGNSTLWNLMWNEFSNEHDAQEKIKLMNGLAAIRDPIILNKFIQLAKDRPDIVRGQDYFTCLNYIAANPIGEPLVWDFVRNNWEYLVNRFSLNDRYLGQMVRTITSKFTTKVKLAEMEDFFRKYPNAGAGTTSRAQALENVKNNIKWLEKNLDGITKWLNDNINS